MNTDHLRPGFRSPVSGSLQNNSGAPRAAGLTSGLFCVRSGTSALQQHKVAPAEEASGGFCRINFYL